MIHRRNIQLGFASPITTSTIGGLILCGMNEECGHAMPDKYATEVLSWTPYFSHYLNGCELQPAIKEWFSLWQHPLNPDDPTPLDWAIAHTNLFVDGSDIFGDVGRGHEEWVQAIEDLALVAKAIDASGIIFMSTLLGDNIARYVNGDSYSPTEWWHEIGPELVWSSAQCGELELRTARLSSIPVANVGYSNFQGSHERISNSSKIMSPWLDSVLERYLRVQKRIEDVCGYRPCSFGVVSQNLLTSTVRHIRYGRW